MAYSAEISRTSPSCFVFLIDQSGSMGDAFAGDVGRKKADGVADAINRMLQNLAIKCAKEEGVRDYFHVAVIGYGASVGTAWAGELAGRELVPISEIANRPARIEDRRKRVDDGAGGLIDQSVKFPVWFDPTANGATPMCQALAQGTALIERWIVSHPNGFPPVVINITDGEATDGDPTGAAERIRGVRTSDGDTLLFNLHLSSTVGSPIEFPDSDVALADHYAKRLFALSSPLPPHIRDQATNEGFRVTDASRGFVFNADLVAVIKFLDIGTRPSNLR